MHIIHSGTMKVDPQRSWTKQIASGGLTSLSKLSIVFWCAVVAFSAISLKNEHTLLSSLFTTSNGKVVRLRIPSDLDSESTRRLSLNLGGGACEWQVSSIVFIIRRIIITHVNLCHQHSLLLTMCLMIYLSIRLLL